MREKMVIKFYRVPILLSLTLSVLILAITLINEPMQIATVILASLAGMFFLDLDYIMYAYIYDPNSDFSKSVQGFISHMDIRNLVLFVNHHKTEVTELTLNTAFFQAILAAMTLWFVYAGAPFFARVFILSALFNSLYRLGEDFSTGHAKKWFNEIKIAPTNVNITLFVLVILCIASWSLINL